jgi:hypothetical protein
MSLYALLHLWYAQHVSGTSMPIIRSSRLYVCCCHLWCAVLSCWLSGDRCRAAGCATRQRDAARCTDKHTSSLLVFCLTKLGYIFLKRSLSSICVNKSKTDSEEGERCIEAQALWHESNLNIVLQIYCIFRNIWWYHFTFFSFQVIPAQNLFSFVYD